MTVEREHKFLVTSDFPQSALLREAFGAQGLELRLGAPREQHDVYYDTPTYELLRSGAALRIRRYDDLVLATYKAAGEVRGSLHAREEIERPYSVPWPPEILAKLTPLGVVGRLEPLVQLNTRRTRYELWDGQNALAELSLDEVSCVHGANQVAFRELELEAAPALSDPVFADLAAALVPFGLSPHQGDKLSHALTLLGPWPRP